MSTSLSVIVLDTSEGTENVFIPTRSGESYGYEIARWLQQADAIALELGKRPLTSFLYEEIDLYEEAVEMAEEEGNEELAAALTDKLERARLQPEWHDAAEGLDSVRGILGALRDDERVQVVASEVRTTKDGVTWDLETIEAFLAEAVAKSRKFRFEAG